MVTMSILRNLIEFIDVYNVWGLQQNSLTEQSTPLQLIQERNGFDFTINTPQAPRIGAITRPLKDPSILLTGACHVDHEGYDLNEIEQAYYANSGVSVTKDDTWYKDGGGDTKTSAIIQSWLTQTNQIVLDGTDQLVLDHSHFVYKLPIRGEAEYQIRQYASKRPELLRLVSTDYKCGLDVCIDLISGDAESGIIQPIVHIEWDFTNHIEMHRSAQLVADCLKFGNWHKLIAMIKDYNIKAADNNIDAFAQADFRSMAIFGQKSYNLIPTL